MDTLADQYWQTPPMARTFATIAFVMSVSIFVGPLPLGWVNYEFGQVFQFPPQIWRLVTGFLITHPGLGLLFDTYFLYSYMSTLERGHPRFPRKEDLLYYLMFICSTVLVMIYFSGWGALFYLPALTIAMCYTATQDQRGQKASIYFITIPAQLMPYALMFLTYLLDGLPAFMVQLHGLVAAHLYDFLTRIWPEFGGGRNLLPTPAFMSRIVDTPRIFKRDYGTAIRPAGRTPDSSTGSSTGTSSGPLPDSWRTRGRGQRLG